MTSHALPAPRTATWLIVPGLRDAVPEHWQTRLLAQHPAARGVPPTGREPLDLHLRVQAIEQAVAAIEGALLLIAHSGGCIMVAHWARNTRHAARVQGALLATPPDFEQPMPAGYPTLQALQDCGWLPVPRIPLPFPSLVALSQNDPLGSPERVAALARDWGSHTVDLGMVGHLNPASGFGPWPQAVALIEQAANLSRDAGLPRAAR